MMYYHFKLCICVYVYAYACACACVCRPPWGPEEGVRPPQGGALGACKLPGMVLRTKLESSVRAVTTCNVGVSPDA